MEYLGSLGRLIGLPCASQEQSQATERYVHEFTVEGRRRTQVRPVSPRAWDVSVGVTTPRELAPLVEFTTGAWGNGPFRWVPVAAQSGNLLTPRESMLLDRAGVSPTLMEDAGPVRASDGTWSPLSVRVLASSGWVAVAREVPVIPGKPFTFSADVQGGFTPGGVWVAFRDAVGNDVSTGYADAPNAGMRRVSYSTVVPDGAAYADVGIRAATVYATRPQATWTAGPVPWATGQGCKSAVVDGLSESLLMANRFGTYSDISFNVYEVS